MKSMFMSVLLACSLILCCVLPLSVAGQDGIPMEPMGSLVIAMSTDDANLFDAAIRIGTVAVKRGHPVTMLLRVNALKVAVAKNKLSHGRYHPGAKAYILHERGRNGHRGRWLHERNGPQEERSYQGRHPGYSGYRYGGSVQEGCENSQLLM